MHILTIAAAALALIQTAPEAGGAAEVQPGTITVEALPEDAAPPQIGQIFVEAVTDALVDADFVALPPASPARYVARIDLTRTARGAVAANGREASAASDFGNWGARLAVTLPSDKTQLRGLIVTRLKIDILRRTDMQPVWSGSALTVEPEGTAEDDPAALATKLADAALRRFPLTSAEPIPVP